MVRELDMVVLTRDIAERGLKSGDVGAVVHSYADREAFEVEFVAAEGKTIAVLTLTGTDHPARRDSSCQGACNGIAR